MESYASPTSYRISTITSTGCIGAEVNLNVLYDSINVNTTRETFTNVRNGIVYMEYGSKKSTTVYKGYSKKFLINRRKVKPSKRFDNQLTIVYSYEHNNTVSNVNIKIFRNGNIQMTGLKYMELGPLMIEKVIEIIRNVYDNVSKEVVNNIEMLSPSRYQIRLINTDYRVGFEVKRENLFKLMIGEFDNLCSYEPCIYPGVKIQYFWNSENHSKNGLCCCAGKKCYEKKKSGLGFGEGSCKKITIAVFQSGCIIITGSQTIQQINDCYEYVNQILYDNVSKVEKKNTVNDSNAAFHEKKVMLEISKIVRI